MAANTAERIAKPRKAAPRKTLPTDVAVAAQVLTRADRINKFISKYILVPEGALVGKGMELLPEQIEFVRAVYDNLDESGRLITRTGILSIARKNGKSGLISALLGAHVFGPEAVLNAQLYSAARSREQAAVVFKYLAKSIRMNNRLEGLVKITDSGKIIEGKKLGTRYHALSADAQTAHGLSPALVIHDELGQVVGPTDALYEALETAGGAQLEPLSLIISTQAAADKDLLSTLIDDAIRNPTPATVCRLYAAGPDEDIYDEKVWKKVNFALGIFRSLKDFRDYADKARRMPTQEPSFRNLYLNQRISSLSLLTTPSLWKQGNGTPNLDLFYKYPVSIGLDLSATTDLTAAVLSVQDPDTGKVHVIPYVFTPKDTLMERASSDRAPYHVWAERGQLIAVPGNHISYDMVCDFLNIATEGMQIQSIAFDRWRIGVFQQAAERCGFAQQPDIRWSLVGQGFRDMTLRVEKFEQVMLDNMLVHGSHPALNMASQNAVVELDAANNKKVEKSKSSARIDAMVALLMSVYATLVPDEEAEQKKKAAPVTGKSMFFV